MLLLQWQVSLKLMNFFYFSGIGGDVFFVRWRSAEGDDWTCNSCQDQFQTVQNWGPEIPKYRPKPNSTESIQSPGKLTQSRPTVQADSSQWELVKPGKGPSPRTRKEPVGTWKHGGGSQKRSGSVGELLVLRLNGPKGTQRVLWHDAMDELLVVPLITPQLRGFRYKGMPLRLF